MLFNKGLYSQLEDSTDRLVALIKELKESLDSEKKDRNV